MNFTKMHGLGNDFIIVEDLDLQVSDPSGRAQDLCRRRWSVGADGLVLIQPSAEADYRMRIFNADGSEAEMCGNALRCVASYIKERFDTGERLVIEVGGTQKNTLLLPDGMVRVNMGVPELRSDLVPVNGASRKIVNEEITAGDNTFYFSAVGMGNPHCVIYPDHADNISLETVGPLLEHHSMFPRRANVEFVKVLNPQRIEVNVWERGAGRTLACGTGACAAVVAGVQLGRLDGKHPVEVFLPGGMLRIQWKEDGDVLMEGPVEKVFEGEVHGEKQ